MSIVDAKLTIPGIEYRVTGKFITVDKNRGRITIYPPLTTSAILSFSLNQSDEVNKGAKLKTITVPYNIISGSVSNIVVGLVLETYTVGGPVETTVIGVASGFGLTVGNHMGLFTITTPIFVSGTDSYIYRFFLDITNPSTSLNTVIDLYSAELSYDLEVLDGTDSKIVIAPDGTVSISANQEPFHGWWSTTTMIEDNAGSSGPSFWDVTGTAQVYRGISTSPRETTTDEEAVGLVIGDTTNWIKIDTADWAQNFLNDGDVYTPASFSTITGDIAVSSRALYLFPFSTGLYRRITATPPPIRWFDGREVTYPDPNNSIFLFDYFVQFMLESSQGFKQKNATGYVGRSSALALRDTIVNTGITHLTSISRVQRTAAASGYTTIFTTVYHWINPGSTVTIAGFDGTNGWNAFLNGVHIVPFLELTGVRIDAAHVSAASYDYKFMVPVDSSAAVSDTFGGAPTVTTTHGPIIETTEYRPLVAAIYEWMLGTFGTLTQGGLQLRAPAGSDTIYSTFSVMATDIAADTQVDQTVFLYPPPVATTFYNNPAQRLLATQAGTVLQKFTPFNHYFSYPINDPTINSLTVAPAALYDYNIDFSNYVVDARYLWWRMSGTPTSPIHNVATNNGYKSNGSTFTFTAASTNPGSSLWTIWSGKLDGSDEADRKNAIYFGRINPALVAGAQIGYIRLRDLVPPDPEQFAVAAEFNVANYDPLNPPAGARSERKLASDAMSTIMAYVLSLGTPMDKIIIDIRHFETYDFANEMLAQLYFLALAEFIGENRNGIDFYSPLQNVSGSPQFVNPTAYTWFQNWATRVKTSFNTVDVTSNVTAYPTSTFVGTALNPKKIIFLTGQMGCKAEPLVRLCVGNALNKIIGAFTTTVVIGDNNGLTNGVQPERVSHDISQRSPFAKYPNTNPAAQLGAVVERAAAILEAPIGNEYANRLAALVPDVLIDGNFETTVYDDVGLTGPYTGGAALLGPGGAFNTKIDPVAGINTSFRDRALENAIVY